MTKCDQDQMFDDWTGAFLDKLSNTPPPEAIFGVDESIVIPSDW